MLQKTTKQNDTTIGLSDNPNKIFLITKSKVCRGNKSVIRVLNINPIKNLAISQDCPVKKQKIDENMKKSYATVGTMGRSPSPRRRDDRRREDRRDRDRDRDRRRQRTRSRSRSLERRRRSPDRRRSPSPRRRRSRSLSPTPTTSFVPKPKKTFGERPIVTPADLEGKTPEEQEMLKVMGFCGFDTTKGKKVDDNVEAFKYAVSPLSQYPRAAYARAGPVCAPAPQEAPWSLFGRPVTQFHKLLHGCRTERISDISFTCLKYMAIVLAEMRSRSLSPTSTTSFVPMPKKTFGERPIVTPADLEGKLLKNRNRRCV
ncbi:unnamed protein product [Diatraea saccharalis]|uniref:U4/U6.U5 small nuclear ribonucleoprotein 27 kDa protein n=1 Tax=Diatraea saccharalis TaxID=40085 RepID=A0A9N9R4F1_9NEOP|nr:unnamed protein product [Diatraea saccharalis]